MSRTLPDILGHNQAFALAEPPVINLKHIETIEIGIRKLIEKTLISGCIDMRKLQEEA